MIGTILIWSVCSLSVPLTTGVVINQLHVFEQVSAFEGYIDDTNIIRTSNVSIVTKCARTCARNNDCVAFYFTTTTKECQEQSAFSSSDMTGTRLKSNTLYYRTTVDVPATFICPAQDGGWVTGMLSDGSMYQFIVFNDVNVNYDTAFTFCQSRGANLPKIYTKEKMDFYLGNIMTCPDVYGHGFLVDGTNINATDYNAVDAFRTHDDIVIPLTTDLWADDRPNKPNVQHCIHSRLEDFNYKFDDTKCNEAVHQILCEKIISN